VSKQTDTMHNLRNQFHLWAFHTAYETQDRDVSPLIRFVRALNLSSQPVADDRILAWAGVRKEIKAIRRRYFSHDGRVYQGRAEAYLTEIASTIAEHLGAKVQFRAWELQPSEEHND